MLFSFLGNDYILNEFLWRADQSVGILKQHLDQILISNGFIDVYVTTKILPSGVYINVIRNNSKIWHMSFHLHKINKSHTIPGALHIQNNKNTQFKTYEISTIKYKQYKNGNTRNNRTNKKNMSIN